MNKSIAFQALQYNVPRGKKNRGLATVLAYKTLVSDPSQLTEENVRLAHYLGWCVEMVSIESFNYIFALRCIFQSARIQ